MVKLLKKTLHGNKSSNNPLLKTAYLAGLIDGRAIISIKLSTFFSAKFFSLQIVVKSKYKIIYILSGLLLDAFNINTQS